MEPVVGLVIATFGIVVSGAGGADETVILTPIVLKLPALSLTLAAIR